MIPLQPEVFDLELENTQLDFDDEFSRISDEDPLFMNVIQEGIDKMVAASIENKKGLMFINTEKAERIMAEVCLTLRRLIEVNEEINEVENE